MDIPSRQRSFLIFIFSFALLFRPHLLQLAASTGSAKGRFEFRCNGVSLFLSNIAGAPDKLELFLTIGFPPGTQGGHYLGQGRWSDVSVYSNGCISGKCVAHGKVWIDGALLGPEDPPPKRISGKYELDLNGKHLEGDFVAREHHYAWWEHKHVEVCM